MNLRALVCFGCLAASFLTASAELPPLLTMTEIVKQSNKELTDLAQPAMSEADVVAAILAGVSAKGPLQSGNVEGGQQMRVFLSALAIERKLTLPVKVSVDEWDQEYSYVTADGEEFSLKGPARTVVSLRLFEPPFGERLGWIEIPLRTITQAPSAK